MKTDSNSYSKMKEEGARFLFIRDFNRDTNSRSLKSLKESVVRNGGYLVPIQVMKVGKYREAYPDTILVDPENDRQTVERTEEKETDYLVLDGQHRLSVHIGLLSDVKKSKETLAIDLPVQEITLPEGMDPHEYIYTLNTTGTQWNDKDRTKFILAEKDNEKTGLYVANQWQKNYGLGIRNATAIIQLNDGYRASMQKKYMEKGNLDPFLKSTPENIARGDKIFNSLKVGFMENPKMLKNMAPILAIIEVYGKTGDSRKSEVIDQLCLFFKTIKPEDVNRIAGLKSTPDKQKEFVCLWDEFKMDFDSKKTFQEEMKTEAQRREKEYSSKSNTLPTTNKKNEKSSPTVD